MTYHDTSIVKHLAALRGIISLGFHLTDKSRAQIPIVSKQNFPSLWAASNVQIMTQPAEPLLCSHQKQRDKNKCFYPAQPIHFNSLWLRTWSWWKENITFPNATAGWYIHVNIRGVNGVTRDWKYWNCKSDDVKRDYFRVTRSDHFLFDGKPLWKEKSWILLLSFTLMGLFRTNGSFWTSLFVEHWEPNLICERAVHLTLSDILLLLLKF
jgi:hypothetical protein